MAFFKFVSLSTSRQMGGVFTRILPALRKLLCLCRRSDKANDGHCDPQKAHEHSPLSDLCCGLNLYRLDRPHEGNDRIKIAGCDLGVPVIRHRPGEFGAVRANGFGDRILDIVSLHLPMPSSGSGVMLRLTLGAISP